MSERIVSIPIIGKIWSSINPKLRDHIIRAPLAFVCGVLGAVIGWATLILFTDFIGWFYLVSAIVSTFLNITFNFIANDKLTFRNLSTGKNWIRRYLEFWTTYGIGAAIDYGLLAMFTSGFGIDHKISWWLAVACVGFLRYIGMYYWVWRKRYV